jgi:hypothetical protein
MEEKSMGNGRCWHCGQPRTCQHETLTCGSEECVTAALKQQERIASKVAEKQAQINARYAYYKQRPEVKDKAREYMREYQQRPDVKAKRREYNQRPEVKAKRREYNQRPEVKARKREFARARYHRLRRAQEEE